MKKLAISFLTLCVLGVSGTAYVDQEWPEEDDYLTFEYDGEYDTDDDYCFYQYEEEDEYLVSCEGGKCPREMVERLRREKREERARKNGTYYDETDEADETAEQKKQFIV